mmetsp:Transcript_32360/g.68962  ORF Transcript_32360/g.68962 Transcript_32360/m.68962 type:complete len:522 (+) Transcript_32360:73-1638(+)
MPRFVAILCVALAVLQYNCRSVLAQIYHFDNVEVPKNRSLHTLYAFYVYSMEEAPERSQGAPFVKFSDLAVHSTSLTVKDTDLQAYKGVQLSIMRYKEFWNLINPRKFCSTQDDVVNGFSQEKDQLLVQKPIEMRNRDVDVYISTLRFPNSTGAVSKDVRRTVRTTGVYILVFSNCGDFFEAKVTGTVIVKNAYGFLPGNEYHKLPFYGWLLLVYVGLAVIWLLLSIRWWKELFNIQNCIAGVIFLGLLESFLWFIFFQDWNHTGLRGKFLFMLSILLTVVKSTLSYMLVLVASLGWGVTRPFLDSQVILKIQILCFFYIVLDFIRETVLSFRHSHSLSLAFVLLCLLPVSLLNGGIFYWVFTALSSLMDTLRERRQFEKLLLFQRLWKILILCLTMATLTLLFQIVNLSRSITARWKYQWLLTDGVSHGLFLFVLAAMMYLWAPHKYSQRFAYSQQIDDSEREVGNNHIWADEDGPDGEVEDGDSFWAATHGGAEPGFDTELKSSASADVIGAARSRGPE